MKGCFLGIENVKINNNSDIIKKIKCILHQYFYSNSDYISILINNFYDCFEDAEISFRSDDMTIMIKMSKSLKKSIIKQCKKMKMDINDSAYFYNTLSIHFHDFLLSIIDDFRSALDNYSSELDDEDTSKLYEAFFSMVQGSSAIYDLTHIINVMQHENTIIVQL